MKKRKMNNDGSAILTVIVVVVFITILATTMLYITSMNYRMKQTDYLNKKSFYLAEEALDALKAKLVEDMSEAFEYAYQEVMVQYASLDEENRQVVFQDAFLNRLSTMWTQRAVAASGDLTAAIQNVVPVEYAGNFVYQDVSEGEAAAAFGIDRTNARFVLQNVRVRYVEEGYSSFICTDIALCVPHLELAYNSFSSITEGTAQLTRETVVLTDYIIYMNWSKY